MGFSSLSAAAARPPVSTSSVELLFRKGGLDLGLRLGVGVGFQVVADLDRCRAAPFSRDTESVSRRFGAHGGAVDRLLEALVELLLGALAALLDDDLGGNVAPVDDNELSHLMLYLFSVCTLARRPSP